MNNFKFSHGNSKLNKDTIIFNLPAGKTCPGASSCLAFAKELDNGKRTIVDGPDMQFRCFAACSEAQYPAVYNARRHNHTLVLKLQDDWAGLTYQLYTDLNNNRKKSTKKVRIHESGDFFTLNYFSAWVTVARANPDLIFYAYSKNLPMILEFGLENLPENFFITASKGGKYDHLIDEGFFPRYSVVVKNDEEAEAMGLEVDHDDSHCYTQNGPFALLVHGNQPAGSVYRKAISERKKAGQFTGYNGKLKVAA